MPYRIRRRLGACALAVLALFAFSGTAAADSASLSVTTTGGQSDPVADVARTFTITGNTASPKNIYVAHRPAGGAACAPSASTDTGDNNFWYGEDVNGDFSFSRAYTWNDGPGSFQFCIWIADNSSQVVTPITQVITFRSPSGTISATLDPAVPRPGQTTTVTVTGRSEAPKSVYATIRRAGGAPCAATFDADVDSSEGLFSGNDVNGAFSESTTMAQERAGDYLLCLWLAETGRDTKPVAGPQPIPFTVAAPPRPSCVVPRVRRGMRLATVKRRIRRAHCRVGKVRKRRSGSVRRGRVIKTSLPRGTRLKNRARVGIVVSRGRR
jgi:hypothetical protein